MMQAGMVMANSGSLLAYGQAQHKVQTLPAF